MERVAKLMAERGLCSRREAERLIEAGAVLVDGVPVRAQGTKAARDADIRVTAAGDDVLRDKLTVLLHKPPGVVSVQPEPGQTPAWKLLTAATAFEGVASDVVRRVTSEASTFAVAGRLDRASRGLLVLTQDGVVARRIIGGHDVRKSYVVRTGAPASDAQIARLRGRVLLDGRVLRPMRVERLSARVLRFVLEEGRKHQIRRVCRKVGLQAEDLFRAAVGPFRIDDLPEGRWRPATADEMEALRELKVES